MKWLAMTRVFRLGSILKVAVPAAAALMVAAFLAGQQWQSGRQAQQDLRETRQQQARHDRLADHQHQEAVGYEQRRADRAEASRLTDAELRAFIAARPDLWGCDVGDDGLRIIRRWIEPDPAAGEPDRPVSDTAADAGLWPAARPAGSDEDVE